MKRNAYAGSLASGGFRLEVFTRDEKEHIHLATLDVLERTGVFIGSEEGQEILAGAGCRVETNGVVKIPGHVVEDATRSAPARVLCCGREPRQDYLLEDRRVGFTCFGEAIQVVDPYTGELRDSMKQDVANVVKVVDALPELDVCHRPLGAHDVPPETQPLHNAEAVFTNTGKHVVIGPITGYCASHMREMAAAIVGDQQLRERPIMTWTICPISPLRLNRDTCDLIIEAARSDVPMFIGTMAMAGGSSPVPLAGTVVTHNAEVLACITLGQLTKKGAPSIYGSSTCALDLRYGTATVGSPEYGMIGAAAAAMAKYYRLPSYTGGL